MWSAIGTTCYRWAASLVVATILFFAPAPVRAGNIVNVTVPTVTFTGNTLCGGQSCVETFSGSFQWDNATNSVVPGSTQITTTGPLGNFSFYGTLFSQSGTQELIGATWINSTGDSLTADIEIAGTALTPGTYPIIGSFQPGQAGVGLGCFSAACKSFFFPSQEAHSERRQPG